MDRPTGRSPVLHPFVGNLAPWCRRSTSCLMIAAAIAVVAALSLNAGATSITGAKIAFTSNRSGTVQIHLMNADGSDVTPLTHPPGHSAYPAFSPDGRKIAFMSDRGGSDQIYVMNADGSKAVQITHLKGTFDRPRFSADGRRIAFTFIGRPGSPDTTSQIYIINADGSNPRPLTDVRYICDGVTFSRDGRRMAIACLDGAVMNIFSMNAAGSRPARITHGTFDSAHGGGTMPDFSPDGRRIAFAHFGEVPSASSRTTIFAIYVMNADGSNMTQLTQRPSEPAPADIHDIYPVFSPDGRKIAFESNRDGTMQIYLMNVDGSNLLRLTNHPGDNWAPAFAP